MIDITSRGQHHGALNVLICCKWISARRRSFYPWSRDEGEAARHDDLA